MTPDTYRTLMEYRIGEASRLMMEAVQFAADGGNVLSSDARHELAMLRDAASHLVKLDDAARRKRNLPGRKVA